MNSRPDTLRLRPSCEPGVVPDLRHACAKSLQELEPQIERDFASKAPTASEIVDRIASDHYASAYEILRDAIRYLYWANRYFLTLYALRPCRWEDLPWDDPEARLPVVVALNGAQDLDVALSNAVARICAGCPDDRSRLVLEHLQGPLASVTFDPARLRAILPTVPLTIRNPDASVMRVPGPRLSSNNTPRREIAHQRDGAPEVTALMRQAFAIASDHVGRWGRPQPTRVRALGPRDFVLLAWPRSPEVAELARKQPSAQGRGDAHRGAA